jgi:putative Mg2+ transporter-C (MgtC) family protein
VDVTSWQETAFRLVLSLLLGSVIGIERELHGKEAGLRPMTLVALGSTLFTLITFAALPHGTGLTIDPSRIAAQIVTGVGFLGAGTIIQARGAVYGLTTAAAIWIVAAVGTAVGVGYYRGAALTTALGVTTLLLLQFLERKVTKLRPMRSEVRASLPPRHDPLWVGEFARELGIDSVSWEVQPEGEQSKLRFEAYLREDQLQKLLRKLRDQGAIGEISVTRS